MLNIFTPNLGEDEPILTCAYFSDGLVQPPPGIKVPALVAHQRLCSRNRGPQPSRLGLFTTDTRLSMLGEYGEVHVHPSEIL